MFHQCKDTFNVTLQFHNTEYNPPKKHTIFKLHFTYSPIKYLYFYRKKQKTRFSKKTCTIKKNIIILPPSIRITQIIYCGQPYIHTIELLYKNMKEYRYHPLFL